MFAWYWLIDLCLEEHIPFVFGHALYMKAIHGGCRETTPDPFDFPIPLISPSWGGGQEEKRPAAALALPAARRMARQ
jgi:hypothetical protein